MTINDLLEGGITIQCLGLVSHPTEADEANPYGSDQVLFEGMIIDLHSPIERDWARREISCIYPLPGQGERSCMYPIVAIEVR